MASSSSSAALSTSSGTSTNSADVVLSWAEPADIKECIKLIMDETGDQDPVRSALYEDAKHTAHVLATVAWMYEEISTEARSDDCMKIVKAVRVRDGRIVGVLEAAKTIGDRVKLSGAPDYVLELESNADDRDDVDVDVDAGNESESESESESSTISTSDTDTVSATGQQPRTRGPVPEDILEKPVAELTDEDCRRIRAWATDQDLMDDEVSIRNDISEVAKPLGRSYNVNVVAITPDAKGQGIGARLVEFLRREFTDSLGYGLIAHCGRESKGFFEKSGFEFKGEKVSKTGQERLWLWCPAAAGRGENKREV